MHISIFIMEGDIVALDHMMRPASTIHDRIDAFLRDTVDIKSGVHYKGIRISARPIFFLEILVLYMPRLCLPEP
ncbi:MAG: hypothetical protein LBQ00_08485 [Syntrophobacterales bacterium]|nr:hypothetical protein [Syntrophobacterales bacterium]